VRRALDSGRKAKSAGGKPTLLVTGSTGFIGQAFCTALRCEFNLVTPSRHELELETGTVQLGLLVEEHDVDSVLHLANPRVYTSNQALGSTLTMLRNVLEVCAFRGLRLVYPSGWEVYSGYAGNVVASEALPRFPSGPYGETKYLAEIMVDHWRATRGLKCAVVRSSPVYGPGAQRPKFIYNFIEKIRRSEKIVTHRYLNGAPALDLLYVDDLIDALARVCRREFVGDLNVGTQCLTATSLIAEMLRAEMGGASSIEETQIESHVACISMNYSKAADVLGWAPRVTLPDGLRAVLQHLHGSAA
jgi:UDP-glucuronate decarboxylase